MKTVLKLDYDGPYVPRSVIERRLAIVGYRISQYERRKSPSGKGWHTVVVLDTPSELPPLEVVALQAILGSDPRREAHNLFRVRALPNVDDYWRRRWNVLYGRRQRDE